MQEFFFGIRSGENYLWALFSVTVFIKVKKEDTSWKIILAFKSISFFLGF